MTKKEKKLFETFSKNARVFGKGRLLYAISSDGSEPRYNATSIVSGTHGNLEAGCPYELWKAFLARKTESRNF
jgi:hypothetical protein